MIAVTILGNNSAVPAYNRHPTSQIVTIAQGLYMVDCGEGTQLQMMRYNIRRSKINHIFISHLHGDHYFGLVGLITSFGLIGRTQDLTIYAPGNLQAIIDLHLQAGQVTLPYTLHIIPITQPGTLLLTTKVKVSCFATNHRITCYGFTFEEVKCARKILAQQCIAHNIPAAYYNALQQGADYTLKDGTIIPNYMVTTAAPLPMKYAYCADTKYDESIIPYIHKANLLYHEATYLHELAAKATERYHSTTVHAATIATKAEAAKLLIGHFSSKYEHIEPFEAEAKAVFTHTQLAIEGTTYLA